ncbi:DUF4234 domain-containing protein [Plantibacter sp. Mn2098]|uniref:DUF4234 domain-containing protein n=1 Tax=Plantibacter sp. Mn2098 TaxID=3395266 RepID=UPI003BC8040D
MKRRSPAAVFFLPIITLGIYFIVWYAKTRGELKAQGQSVPTTWLFIVPIVSFWWLWKFSVGAANVSGKSAGGTFALLLLGSIGQAIAQNGFNKRNVAPVAVEVPVAA